MTAQKSVTEKDNQDEQYHTNHISFFDRKTTLEEPNCLQISERLFFSRRICVFSVSSLWVVQNQWIEDTESYGFSQYSGEISSSHWYLEVKETSPSPCGGM